MTDEVTLLGLWESAYVMRVRIVLAEKGINYEYIEDNLLEKSHFLLQMNPIHKKVPVLIHNGKPICESLIIVQYIDDVWNKKSSLLPSDPYDRAQARFWADYVDKKIYDVGSRIWKNNEEEQEKGKVELIECLKVLEGELGEKSYFGGESFGYVDMAFVPFYTWFYSFETIGKFSVEVECPKLIPWVKRCMERESVSKTLPDPKKVHDLILVLMEKRLWD